MSQPPVRALPTDIDLTGLVAVVTGATSGLGLETARQLLQRGASTVILAIRNLTKGEAVKQQLLSDPVVKRKNSSGKVELLKLDVSSDSSITSFASTLQQKFPVVNLLVLNAGGNSLKYSTVSNGHESSLQLFYLSNALLINLLLPYLEASTAKSNRVSRITVLGSRYAWVNKHTLEAKPVGANENVIAHFDDEKLFNMSTNYSDVKLLVYMYVSEVASRLDPQKVVIDSLCPGMVDTNLTDYLPWFIRGPVKLLKMARARPVEVGGRIVLNAAVVAKDKDAHGTFFWDMDAGEKHPFADSNEGLKLRQRLYEDTNAEIKKVAALAPELA